MTQRICGAPLLPRPDGKFAIQNAHLAMNHLGRFIGGNEPVGVDETIT